MTKRFLGFHYDIARGTYLKPAIFCRALRLAAESGYTHFLPYLENMISLPSMERACPTCAYTAEDWKEFESVACEVGIEIVPHFNVIGHSELIAPAYPELCGEINGREHQEIDATSPAARQWMLRCLGEFCEFSHSQYFLIGGDEWQPPRHLLAQPGFDVARTWGDQVNAAVEFLVQRGRRPIVWHDMLIHYPAALAMLSKEAVIAFWFYDYDSDYAALATLKALGFKTLMASAVFDGGLPMVGRRAISSLRRATTDADRHGCDGMIVTSWESCRWELESSAIPLAAQVIRGDEPAAEIVDAATLFSAWIKLPCASPQARQWRSEMEALLGQPGWDAAPDMRRVLRAKLKGDVRDDVASYVQYHHPQGRGYQHAATLQPQPDWPAPSINAFGSTFGINVVSDEKHGDVLQFFNGEESFIVYPRFGASLQSWQRSGSVIIPGTLERLLKRGMLPGGYRSYTAAGGFRVVWAMGTHSNPCILWQHPWAWSITEQTQETVAVELKLELPHGAFVIVITIARGTSGFAYEARCVNQLEHAYGAFNFNLPLPLSLEDLSNMKFMWDDPERAHEVTVAGCAESAFWIPASGALTLRRPNWDLHIDSVPEQTSGYFVDWGAGFITPDLHGVYQPLKIGQETVARWHFKTEPFSPTCSG